jgi:hypothetical protein
MATVPPLLKSIQTGHRRIVRRIASNVAPDHYTAVQMGMMAIAATPLCVARGLLSATHLETLQDATPIEEAIAHLLTDLNQQGRLGFPAINRKRFKAIIRAQKSDWVALVKLVGDRPFPIPWLGMLYEMGMAQQTTQRKVSGAYYTPPELVQAILEPWDSASPNSTLLDPACGGGAFLLAAYDRLLRRLPNADADERSHCLQTQIFGIDRDPLAVSVTRLSLLLRLLDECSMPANGLPDLTRTIHAGNSLVEAEHDPEQVLGGQDWQRRFAEVQQCEGFDVVVGNPPYLDAEGMTRHQPHLRRYCTQHYRTATGNWDLFCVFIERALSLCKPGGWHSFVVPNKLLSAGYGAATRSLLACDHQLTHLRDYSRVSVFPAAIYPIVYHVRRSPPMASTQVCYEEMASLEQVARQTWLPLHTLQTPQHPWRMGGTPKQGAAIATLQSAPTLADYATLMDAATVTEAYAIRPLIREAASGDAIASPDGFRVVNSGTLDPYQMLWGKKPLRYLGDRYLHPIIPQMALADLPPKRLHQARQPKLLVASMTRRLEVVFDEAGQWFAGKSTTIILPQVNPYWLLALLNSELIQRWFCQTFAGNRLQGGYLRIGAPQLRQIPVRLPKGKMGDRLSRLTQQRIALATNPNPAQQQAIDAEIDALIYKLYKLTPDQLQD